MSAFRWYDMDGTPISVEEWSRRYGEGMARSVARTKIGEGYVSTVLLGSDHAFNGGPPIIFESMAFPGCERCERYHTRAEALAGHAAMVAEVQAEHDAEQEKARLLEAKAIARRTTR